MKQTSLHGISETWRKICPPIADFFFSSLDLSCHHTLSTQTQLCLNLVFYFTHAWPEDSLAAVTQNETPKGRSDVSLACSLWEVVTVAGVGSKRKQMGWSKSFNKSFNTEKGKALSFWNLQAYFMQWSCNVSLLIFVKSFEKTYDCKATINYK